MTPEQFRARLQTWAEKALPDLMRDALEVAAARIAARATQTYMRDAKASGEAGVATRLRFTKSGRIRRGGRRYLHVRPRRPGDAGPLRIVTGDLVRAVRDTRNGGIERISAEGLRWKLEKGVDLGKVPYARVHEYGGSFSIVSQRRTVHIPARPYLRPALRDEAPEIQRITQRRFTAAVKRAIRGVPA